MCHESNTHREQCGRNDPDREKIQHVKEVLLHQSYRNYFLFVFGINSGLRISDIIHLKVLDVKNVDYLKVREKKTKKVRRIKMTITLKNEIDKYIRSRADSDYLFPSRKGQQPISRVQAWFCCRTINLIK